MKKKLLAAMLSLVMVMSLGACGSSSSESEEPAAEAEGEKQKITVGCLARDEEIINWIADKLADKYDIEAQVYSETVTIMQAAAEGENDLNYIANIPYLNSYNESYGSDLVFFQDQITNSPVYIISQKYESIDEIGDGAIVGVANDAANRKRELNIFVEAGLIELDESVENPSALDVTSNPKNLDIKEVDARSRVGALPDYDAMTMPAMTFQQMDEETRESCFILASESDQACVDVAGQGFCTLKDNVDAEYLMDMWEVACTKEFADWLLETYEGARIPSGYLLQSGEVEYVNPSFEVPDIY